MSSGQEIHGGSCTVCGAQSGQMHQSQQCFSGMISLESLQQGKSDARKGVPIATGCLDYFPAALAMVARVSKAGNDKHNPGQDMHHARGKSMDHADCIMRHLSERGTIDPEDGLPHSGKIAWRALALLQEELEAAGAPIARGAR